jgi:hypothetical protein
MIVSRTTHVTKKVTNCYECPYAHPGPRENTCELLEDKKDCYANIVPFWEIDARCPLLKKERLKWEEKA